MDEDERESNASSDNERDEMMEDADGFGPGNEAEDEGREADEDPDLVEPQDTTTIVDNPDNPDNEKAEDGGDGDDDGAYNGAPRTSVEPHSAGLHAGHWKAVPRPEYVNARLYDIVPTMAAPQSTSINAISITPDLRYWITGGSDGYIRKYDGAGTINGKQLLTVAQRHPFVDSVVKAGILMSYWENEEPSSTSNKGADDHVLSPVYSLAIHSQALWLLSGLESGGINLQSVRHDEGKRIACLQQHSNAVSVLTLATDEKSVLSGSWDKRIFDWDLNNGQVKRQFDGSGGQISALEPRPANAAPIPAEAGEVTVKSETFSSSNGMALPSGALMNGMDEPADGIGQSDTHMELASEVPGGSEHESLFGSPGGSLFGEDALGEPAFGGEDDVNNNEFSDAMLALQGDSREAQGPAGQTGDFPMPELDISDAPPVGPTSAPSISMQSMPDANAPTQGQDPGVQLAGQEVAADGATTLVIDPPADPSFGFLEQPPQQPAVRETEQAAPDSPSLVFSSNVPSAQLDSTQSSDSTFFSASIDGPIRVWDRRMPNPVARIDNRPGVPPWCMGACWSPDGNWIYAGRRNGTVEEFNIHKARNGWEPTRTLKFPQGSGPVSAVRPMVNGRHLVCASYDILRLYDLRDTSAFKHSAVPFLIIPGPPRAGVISSLYIDPTSRFMVSVAGTRGWEGSNTEVMIGYEINVGTG